MKAVNTRGREKLADALRRVPESRHMPPSEHSMSV